jgi:hypothetical protein
MKHARRWRWRWRWRRAITYATVLALPSWCDGIHSNTGD